MKCADCKRPGEAPEMVIDHLLPRSHAGFNQEENMRFVHRNCNKKQPWYKRLWYRIQKLFKDWQAERRRVRELNILLDGLVDPTFLDRAYGGKMSSLDTLIGFRDQQLSRGVPVTPELTQQIAHAGYLKIHDRHYKRLTIIGRWMHRRRCSEVHNA